MLCSEGLNAFSLFFNQVNLLRDKNTHAPRTSRCMLRQTRENMTFRAVAETNTNRWKIAHIGQIISSLIRRM